MKRAYKNLKPQIDSSVFVAENAVVIGDVRIGMNSSIWYGCVLRGDVDYIGIGKNTNIQDGTVVHVSSAEQGQTLIGDNVTVGHMALIHACTIGNDAFIGMKACIMDGAVVEPGAMVGAGALVTPGKVVKTGQLWAGVPARFIRDLTKEDTAHMAWSWSHYVRLSKDYL